MSDPSSLRSRKGLLTRYCNNLTRLIDDFEAEKECKVPTTHDLNNIEQTEMFVLEVQATSDSVPKALDSYTESIDSLQQPLNED
ncbi:hypothetical protein RB195_025563 [Necator americanus]